MKIFRVNSNPYWAIWAVALIGILLFQALPGPKTLDDAYITYRYARNISQGMGFVYNPGERVQGTTTPLYTLLLAGTAALFGAGNLPVISFLIGLIADFFNVILLFRLSRHILQNTTAAFTVAIVFLFHPFRLNVAAGGMETSLFILFLLGMYNCYLVDRSVTKAAIWAALALLTRLDAALAIAPVFLHALFQHRRSVLKAAAAAAILTLPWFVWAAWYFGNPIPLSILAKKAAYQDLSVLINLLFLFNFLGTGTVGPYQQPLMFLPGLAIFLILAYVGIRRLLHQNRQALIVVLYPILYYLVMGLQNAPMFFIWYYPPLMPGLLLILFSGLQQIIETRQVRSPQIAFGLAALVLLLVPGILLKFDPGWAGSREIERAYQGACQQVSGVVGKGQQVFAPDIGVLGWCLEEARILDPIGLISPEVLKYYGNGAPVQQVSSLIVSNIQPDYVLSREQYLQDMIHQRWFNQEYHPLGKQMVSGDSKNPVFLYARVR